MSLPSMLDQISGVSTRRKIYLIGSLRNPEVPKIANRLRRAGFDVFDDWAAASPTADDAWRDYEKARGRTMAEALQGHAARHIFEFDLEHLRAADIVVCAGRPGMSAALELGWALGKGKDGYVVFDGDPERWDVMLQFATGIFYDLDSLIEHLKSDIF